MRTRCGAHASARHRCEHGRAAARIGRAFDPGRIVGGVRVPGHGTIYACSTVRYTLLDARELDDRVILAHARGHLRVPAGPLAGESDALASIVLVRDGDDHRIAAFHNTLVAAR